MAHLGTKHSEYGPLLEKFGIQRYTYTYIQCKWSKRKYFLRQTLTQKSIIKSKLLVPIWFIMKSAAAFGSNPFWRAALIMTASGVVSPIMLCIDSMHEFRRAENERECDWKRTERKEISKHKIIFRPKISDFRNQKWLSGISQKSLFYGCSWQGHFMWPTKLGFHKVHWEKRQ